MENAIELDKKKTLEQIKQKFESNKFASAYMVKSDNTKEINCTIADDKFILTQVYDIIK
jgi:hypothetical protein